MTEQTLRLTDEETQELLMLMQREIAKSAVEVRHTDARAYRELIRHRVTVLESVLAKLEAASQPTTIS